MGDRRTAAPDRGRPCSLCPVGGSQSAADENGGAFGCKFKLFFSIFFYTGKNPILFREKSYFIPGFFLFFTGFFSIF